MILSRLLSMAPGNVKHLKAGVMILCLTLLMILSRLLSMAPGNVKQLKAGVMMLKFDTINDVV